MKTSSNAPSLNHTSKAEGNLKAEHPSSANSSKRTTYQPQLMPEQIEEGFSLLSHQASALAIANRLTGSQFRLWHYLLLIDQYGDQTSSGERIYHDIPSPAQIGLAIGASPKVVERDMRRLERLGLYAKRITGWQGHNLTAAQARLTSANMKQAKKEKLNKPIRSAKSVPVENGNYLVPDRHYLVPDRHYLVPDGNYLVPVENAENHAPSQVQAICVPDQTIQNISENKKEGEALLEIFDQDCKRQPPASLLTESQPTSEKLKDAGEDQFSAAGPTSIKLALEAFSRGGATYDDSRPRHREISRSIPGGYIDEAQEILSKHQGRLEKLVDLSSETLQETVNAHPHNLELAIEAFLEKCSKGVIDHPERYLNAAVREGWKPRNQPNASDSPSRALTPEFLKAYEQMCAQGIVLQEPPQSLPVIMGVVSVRVRVPNPNRKSWEPPYELMPWPKALATAITACRLPDIGDDQW